MARSWARTITTISSFDRSRPRIDRRIGLLATRTSSALSRPRRFKATLANPEPGGHHRKVSGNWRSERLPELVRALAGRPRHEALRGHITDLLRSGFDAPYSEIGQEVYLLDGSGRIDTMWGATVIELKGDLRRELGDVHARLPDYLRDAAQRARSPRPLVGIATDGATFIAYAASRRRPA